MSWISECCKDEDRNQDARKASQDIRGPPAIPRDVGIGDVDTKDKGEAITVVNTPTEDTIGYTSVVSSEHFSNQRSTNWSKSK